MENLGVYKGVIRECVDKTFNGNDYSTYDNVVLKSASEDWTALGT